MNWIPFATAFAASYLCLIIAWAIVHKRISIFAKSTENQFTHTLVDWLIWPIRIGLIISSLKIAVLFAPESFSATSLVSQTTKIILIFLGTWIGGKALILLISSRMASAQVDKTTTVFFSRIIWVVTFILGFLIILDSFGISITPIIASLGVGSLAIGLALQDTLSNFFGGMYVVLDKPFRVDDFIKIDENTEGHVIRIGWRTTHIRLLTNNIVVVPNSKVAAAQLLNYDLGDKEVVFLVPLGVSYDSDLDKVEKVAAETATQFMQTHSKGVPSFTPVVRFRSFAESSIDFIVVLRCKSQLDVPAVRSDFIKALHKTFKNHDIEIPFPQRVLHFTNKPELN